MVPVFYLLCTCATVAQQHRHCLTASVTTWLRACTRQRRSDLSVVLSQTRLYTRRSTVHIAFV